MLENGPSSAFAEHFHRLVDPKQGLADRVLLPIPLKVPANPRGASSRDMGADER